MRFCFIAMDYPTETAGGGVGTYYQTVARYLCERGHGVLVIVKGEKGRDQPQADGPIAIRAFFSGQLHWYLSRIPLVRKAAPALRELETGWSVWRLVRKLHRREPFDIVECSETGGWLLALLRKRFSFPFIIRLHGERFTRYRHCPDLKVGWNLWLERRIQLFAISRASFLTAPSRHHARVVNQELRRERPITVFPNFLDERGFTGNVHATAPSPQEPVTLYVGRLEPIKGIWALAKAAPRVVAAVPGVRFQLVGGFHPSLDREAFLDFLKRHDLEQHVSLLGHIPHSRLAAYYRACSLFVFPSYYETFGYIFIEAMFQGAPVVGFGGSALEEIVVPGQSGIVVPPGDIEGLSTAIIALLKDEAQRRTLGEAGQKRAREIYARAVVAPVLAKYYEEVGSAP